VDAQRDRSGADRRRWGWDQLGVYWGELLAGAAEPGPARASIFAWHLALCPTSKSEPSVRRAVFESRGEPDPGLGRLIRQRRLRIQLRPWSRRSSTNHLPTRTTRLRSFTDQHIVNYGALHRNEQNAVRGIGLSVFDNSLAYGSQSHRLRGVELFAEFFLAEHESSTHEFLASVGLLYRTGLVSRASRVPATSRPLTTPSGRAGRRSSSGAVPESDVSLKAPPGGR
jgi:hypothetical protein